MPGDVLGAVQDSVDPGDLSVDITYAVPVKFNMNNIPIFLISNDQVGLEDRLPMSIDYHIETVHELPLRTRKR